ncbi:hypothetical protein HMPREF3024_15170 [Achromobacter xylosoxidans]|nr:hypothetical protein HMPREF3024_15170 [Achromobacter xylosoxidans]OMG88723.1 hypothetical protein BIZ53_03285 [Achromobacter xylosoxidans]
MQYMHAVADAYQVDGAERIAPMIVDQFKHARPQSVPWFGRGRSPARLHDEQTHPQVFLNGQREGLEVFFRGTFPIQGTREFDKHEYTCSDITVNLRGDGFGKGIRM